MKKLFLILPIVALFSMSTAAQTARTMSFTTDLGMLTGLTHQIAAKYSIKITEGSALVIPFAIGGVTTCAAGQKCELRDATVALGLGWRFFLSNDAFHDSWFIEPAIWGSINRDKFSIEAASALPARESLGLESRLILGYNWVLDSGLTLSIGAGGIYQVRSAKSISPEAAAIVQHQFFPSFETAIGYSW